MFRLLIAFLMMISFASHATRVAPGWYDVSDIIAKASIDSGVAADTLAAFAAIESSFIVSIKNSRSTATGLFQFTAPTWRAMVRTYGEKYGLNRNANPRDAYANAVMGAEYYKENERILRTRLKRTPSVVEVYMAHFLSPRRAVAITQAPRHHNVAAMYPAIAAVNPGLLTINGRGRSVGGFIALLEGRVNGALNTYGLLARAAKTEMEEFIEEEKRWQEELLVAMQQSCTPTLEESDIKIEPTLVSTLNLTGMAVTCNYETGNDTPVTSWFLSKVAIRDREVAA